MYWHVLEDAMSLKALRRSRGGLGSLWRDCPAAPDPECRSRKTSYSSAVSHPYSVAEESLDLPLLLSYYIHVAYIHYGYTQRGCLLGFAKGRTND